MSRSMIGAAAAVLLSATTLVQADVLYVDASLATGADDGSSWDDAFQGMLGLQNAIAASTFGDQIWVAAGTYLPTIASPRTISFVLRSGVEIYGGFAGDETAVTERDPIANEVMLSGDLAQDDGSGGSIVENAYHVVTGGTANNTALLCGMTITGGYANGSGNFDKGGGMIMLSNARPRIEDCVVRNNRCTFGGGACYIANASPSFTRVRFESNIGGAFGGAFDIFSSGSGSTVAFDSCRFIDNFASRAGGVEVFGTNCSATLDNCLFFDNRATGNGGAMYVAANGTTTLNNCSVVANSTTGNTGGLHLTGLTSVVRNTIVWHNTDGDGSLSQMIGSASVKYCNIEGGWAAAGPDTIDAEPLFADLAGGDLNLLDGSPGIDAGSNSLTTVTLDLDGGPRFVDDPCTDDTGAGNAPIVDMGALERDDSCKTACPGDVDGDGDVGFNDLVTVLGDWGPCPGCSGDIDGDGDVGFNDLIIVLAGWGPCR